MIAQIGCGAKLLKRDLKSAFRMIPVCMEDQWLLIFEWEGKYYQEMFLPFGLRTAPFLFNLFGEVFQWILQHIYTWTVKRYLDDFLGIFPTDHDLAKTASEFDMVVDKLGFTEATDKRQEGTCVDYLGLILDTKKMEARLPDEKKSRAMSGIELMLAKPMTTTKQLEKLLGLLEFCVSVFPLGRPFLRHVWNMFRKSKKGRYRLTTAARQDLSWWRRFLPIWSGISVIQPSRRMLHVATDASRTKGIGGVWFEGGTDNMFSTWVSCQHRRKHINWKEMFAVLYAFARWSEQWMEARVVVYCDNEAVVKGLRNRTIRGSAIRPLHTLYLIAAR